MPNFFESNAPALSGAAQGLTGAISNLRQAAQDERMRPALEAKSNLEIAMSQDALKRLQDQQKEYDRRRQPINLTDLSREKPMLPYLLKHSPAVVGKDFTNRTDLTVGDYEDLQAAYYNNPRIWKQAIQEASQNTVPMDDKYGNTILTVQKEIQELQSQKDNLTDMRQAEKIDNELSKRNEELAKIVAARKPFEQVRAQTTQYISAIDELINLQDFSKMSANQKQIAEYLKSQNKPWGLAAVEEYERAKKEQTASSASTTTIKKMSTDGKIHYYSMNPKTGKYDIDQGIVAEIYKVNKPIGRSSIDNRMVYSDPEGNIVGASGEPIDPSHSENMKPVTVRGIGAGEAKELADLENTFKRLGDVSAKSEKLKDKFGPVSGRWEKLKIVFAEDGASQRVVNELKSLITIAYGLSGKQITEGELKMLAEAMLPRLEQPYENFKQTLDFAKTWTGELHDTRIDSYRDAYFDIKKPYLIKGRQTKGSASDAGDMERFWKKK